MNFSKQIFVIMIEFKFLICYNLDKILIRVVIQYVHGYRKLKNRKYT